MSERGGAWLDRCRSKMKERRGGGAGWMREWDEGERRESDCMDRGLGCGREEGTRLDG